MRERWDTTCQDILVEAKRASVELENHFLGTEHLAMAMLARPKSRLRTLLATVAVDPDEVSELLGEAITPGPLPIVEGGFPLTPRVRRVVSLADEVCDATGATQIEEPHLLAATLAAGRGVFVRVLEAFGLDPEKLFDDLSVDLEGIRAPAATVGTDVRRVADRKKVVADHTRPAAPRPLLRREGETATFRQPVPPAAPAAPEVPIPDLPQPMPRLPLGANPALLDWGITPSPHRLQPPLSKPRAVTATPAEESLLERLGRDLTREAREGKLPRIIARDDVIDQLQRALCRASRNNPLLLGEAGVGKTAAVEGLAQRIAASNVPAALRDVRIVELPLAAITADTRYRGELEEKLLKLVTEVRQDNVVLLLDDIHTLSAGEGPQTNDAGAVLRPFLARGDLRVIGTTTPGAFSRHIERDTALARCFHPIRVEAPDDETVIEILRSVRQRFENFHEVVVPDATLDAVVRLSHAYLKQRQMPDVAIDLLDEACVKAASGPNRVDLGQTSDGSMRRSGEVGPGVVTAEDVAEVVSQRTGIPVETLSHEERERMARMDQTLRHQVIGQDDAVRRVSERIRMYKAGFREERRPLGVFLFLGPTGVGKTELARAIARFLFNSEDHLVRLDMSEFAEGHEVARLVGPPPGYVGYGEEGQLTGALRRDPHCVILLDEIEKAHPKLFDLFLQVFDDGRLTDGRGTTADFTHAIIVLTSNLGADLWKGEKRIGFRQAPLRRGDEEMASAEEEELRRKRIFEALKGTFRLEFLNRLDEVILFNPLEEPDIRAIARQMVAKWQARSAEQGYPFEVEEDVLDFLCTRGHDPDLGARPMKRAIEQYVVAPLSRLVLAGEIASGRAIRATMRDGRVVFDT